MATYIQQGEFVDYTPSGAGVDAGDVVALGNDFFGVALRDIADGEKGALATGGIFEFVSTGSVAAGALVFWDSENKRVSTAAVNNNYIGRASAAAAGNKCRVFLNATNIGKFTVITPGAAPKATQAAIAALTATDPTCDAAVPTITATDPTCDAADPSITAIDPAEMNAAVPAVTGPTTDGIIGNAYAGEAAAIKAAIEQNDTNVDAVKAELDNLIDDVTAIRTQLVAAIADLATLRDSDKAIIDDVQAIKTSLELAIDDLATLRDSDKAIIDDVQAIETSLEAGIDDLGTLKTAVNAAKTDLAAVVAALPSEVLAK